MKIRKMGTWLLSGLVFLGLALPVRAETFYGEEYWSVTFNSNNEMVSTFSTSNINDVVSGMQPGDNVIISLKLKQENPKPTDWYMKNEVLYSLEDRSVNKETGGGAYTYRLTYKDHGGSLHTLFDSDTVGGENKVTVDETLEGLHGATNALKDFFYLDTLYNKEGGVITLEVALDGETQGNAYQDTLADLEMIFAVELRDDLPDRSENQPPNPVDDTQEDSSGRRTNIVRTGDESKLPLLALISGVTGLMLLVYCIYCFREHRKGKKGE